MLLIVFLGGAVAVVTGDSGSLPKARGGYSGNPVRVAGGVVMLLTGIAIWATWNALDRHID